tara:strand:- start:974 stop:1498 length:525 start_codon:yes stop_codon:yes gene_type:complete
MKKLKDLLSEIFEDEQLVVDKREVVEGVAQYGMIGKQLYSSVNILDIAEQLVKVAESAQDHILSETDDWFDKVSINRNMKSMGAMVKEFKKTAKEYSTTGQRLTALYEDMGNILNRYYDITEEEGDKSEYQAFFRKAAEKFGVDPENVDDLPDEKKKAFFNYIDKNWEGDTESD